VPVGRRRRLESLRFERGQYETVQGGLRPSDVLDRRHGGIDRRPEGPVVAAGWVFRSCRLWWKRHPHLNPARQIGDLPIRQLALGRHLQFVVAVTDSLHEQAAVGSLRCHGGSGTTALENGIPRVEAQTGLSFVGAMTLETMLDEQRADVGLEESYLLRSRWLLSRSSPGGEATECSQVQKHESKRRHCSSNVTHPRRIGTAILREQEAG